MDPANDPSGTDLAALLDRAASGLSSARGDLFHTLHRELHNMARAAMRRERADHTLQPTALVNEAYIRLVRKPVSWQSRSEFFRAAARVMREILIDHARSKASLKRGANCQFVDLDTPQAIVEANPDQIIAIDDALRKLAEFDPRAVQVVELRFFIGLTPDECAQALGVSLKTVTRDWSFARAWLETELGAP